MSGHFVYHLLLALACIWIEVFGFFIGSVVSLFIFRFGESCRLQFLHIGYFERCHTFALCLESLYCYELIGIDFEWRTLHCRAVGSRCRGIVNLQSGINRICKQHQPALLILADVVLRAFGCLHTESLKIQIVVVVGIVQHGCPHLVGVPLLYYLYVRLIMVVSVEG